MSIIAEELYRRFGNQARIDYIDVTLSGLSADHAKTIADITEQGYIYPVTVIDGKPVADRMISFPFIIRAVQSRLLTAGS